VITPPDGFSRLLTANILKFYGTAIRSFGAFLTAYRPSLVAKVGTARQNLLENHVGAVGEISRWPGASLSSVSLGNWRPPPE